jgi:hypothetical protein
MALPKTDRIVREYWVGNKLEGGDRGVIWGTILLFARGGWEKPWNSSVRIAGFRNWFRYVQTEVVGLNSNAIGVACMRFHEGIQTPVCVEWHVLGKSVSTNATNQV